MVLTIGMYVCRAACRREWADPGAAQDLAVGYVLIICGYGILGLRLDRTIHEAVKLWGASIEEAGNRVLIAALVTFLVGGSVGALLVRLGSVARMRE